MTTNNQIKTDAMYQTVQAQQLQLSQAKQELAVQQLGSQSILSDLAW
jgi:hypothetical protein